MRGTENKLNCGKFLLRWFMLFFFLVLLTNITMATPVKDTSNTSINALAFDQTGNNMASARDDGIVTLWNVSNGSIITELSGNSSAVVTGLAFSPNGISLAASSRDSVLRLWDMKSYQVTKELYGTGEAGWILGVVYSPDGKTVAAAGADTKVMLWDVESMSLKVVLEGHKGFVNSVSFSPDSSMLISGSDDGSVKIWQANGRELQTINIGSAVKSVVFSPKGKEIATGGNDGNVKAWNVNTGQLVRIYVNKGTSINSLAYSPDGSMLTGAGDDGSIRTWRTVDGKQIAKVVHVPNIKARSVTYSPNSKIAASGSADGTIKLWNTSTWKQIAGLTEPPKKGNPSISNTTLTTTKAYSTSSISQGPGGPILVITSTGSMNPFGSYYSEILRNEGFNAFQVADISTVNPTMLSSYDIVILAEMTLEGSQVSMLSDWVTGGGRLIAMRPDPQLAGLLGITGPSSTLEGAYILVNTTGSPGKGIVGQTIQYKGTADLYNLNGAMKVAALYRDANTATTNPAVTLRNVGNGQAAAFTYDLAKSVVYLRQGNPAWDLQERDGFSPIRSDDLFYGAAVFDPRADWIDLNKVAIPQADEQQRLLANMIIEMTQDIKPLPRFWYLPHGFKAAVIMTGDDHANGGTAGRFEQYKSLSPANCSVNDWECIRSTSYIYTNTPLSDAQALSYQNQGFEIGLHPNSNCADYSPAELENIYESQLSSWQTKYSSITPPQTNRMHCIAWDGWSVQPSVELNHGIRLDTSYYYWPPVWLTDRPGFFTSSGMPMRFSDLSGNIIDVYQATTQMTDESGQSYPYTSDSLLDNALGPEEYFGVFTVNAHTDRSLSTVSDAVVSSALSRKVPIVSSRQMLDWVDGRYNSTYNSISWNGNSLSFSVAPATSTNGLQLMIPATSKSGSLNNISIDGNPTNYEIKTINGINYAFVDAKAGTFSVGYEADSIPPTVIGNTPLSNATGVNISTYVTAKFSEALDGTTINNGTFELHIGGTSGAIVPSSVSYNDSTFVATLQPMNSLALSTIYTAIIKGGVGGIKDISGNTLGGDYTWSFATNNGTICPCSIWNSSALPNAITVYDPSKVELGIKFRSDKGGSIIGVRFYKGPSNNGTHIGSLWSGNGTLLGRVTFGGETGTGWQQANFTTPINITAGTTYIASYHTNGFYSGDNNYFATSGVDNLPLHALKNGIDGGNGVYVYNTNPTFPSNTWRSSNYWVDIVFEIGATPDITPPIVTSFTIPANYNNLTVPIINFTATDDIGVTGYMITESSTAPLPTADGWSTMAPTLYTFATSGNKTLYAWAKDAAGHISASRNGTVSITIDAGRSVEASGWYAGDVHVHRSCGGAPIAISDMYQKLFQQNLTFMSLLADSGDGEVQDPVQDLPRVNGSDDPISKPGKIVHWDAENHWDPVGVSYPRKNLGDHIVTLGLKDAHQIYEEYSYPLLNWAHQQNGIAGFAHFQYLDNNIPQTLTCCTPIEYPVEVALGSADFISEDDFGSDSFIQAYYRLLNNGFRPGFAAGTDFPCNNPNVGSLLTYVKVEGGQPTYKDWINGIAKGRTVVSRNGHNEFLNLIVNNNAIPGDEINLTGGGNVSVSITWTANQTLSGTIELVNNGVVVASKQTSVDFGSPANLNTTVNFVKSGWLVARRMGSNGHYVHTGAIFVTVDNKPVRASVTDAQFYVQWIDNLLNKTSPGGAWNQYFTNNLSDAQSRYQAARVIYQQIAMEASGPDTSAPIVTANTPANGTIGVSISAVVTAKFSEAMNATTINANTFELQNENMGILVPASVDYNPTTFVATLHPTSPLENLTNYSATVKGGSIDPRVKDMAGNALASNYIWSFTTADGSGCPCSIWNETDIPGLITDPDNSAVELGVKFRSDLNGYITGIRFYKGPSNTGTHVGSLWTNTGTLLAQATFTGETDTGWQQVSFATPVAVIAGTTYVASYHTNVGKYPDDVNYFTNSGVDKAPLHALEDGVDGNNGVYIYSANPAFPNSAWRSSNYWVDVVFTT